MNKTTANDVEAGVVSVFLLLVSMVVALVSLGLIGFAYILEFWTIFGIFAFLLVGSFLSMSHNFISAMKKFGYV